MHELTKASFNVLDELWASIHEQTQQHSEPAYCADLWRMAGNVCNGYALQHQTAGLSDLANTFTWLSDVCATRQRIELNPPALKISPLKLAVVQSLGSVKH